MRILVLAEDYSTPDGRVALHYIHSRNKYYLKQGIDVVVLSFRARHDYEIDGIKVYTKKTYKAKLLSEKYDILLSHAPNLKHHLTFIRRYEKNFPKIVFFFHGHEVLKISEVYPKPFKYTKEDPFIKKNVKNVYDDFKLYVWRKIIPKLVHKSEFIFVSNWMYETFLKFVKLDPKIIENKKHIIYNCVGSDFEDITYNFSTSKEIDFITIRNYLDGSKYGIDIVNNIAKNNSNYNFYVVGKGEFFEHFEKPENLVWINKNLNHKEIIEYLKKSKYALLPTRTDAQGVMACEIATFGIPLITSDIEVCREVFDGFNNVVLIDNNERNIDIDPILKSFKGLSSNTKNKKYFAKNTVGKEVELFREIIGKSDD